MVLQSTPRHVVAVSPMSFEGFDPWVAYRRLRRAGVRYVEVPAMPGNLALKFDVTTFAPEALSESDVRAFKDRLHELDLEPLTVSAMCDPRNPSELHALRLRIDFAQQLGSRYVITDATGDVSDRSQMRRLMNALRWIGDYAADRGICLALETHEGPTRNGKLAKAFLDELDHPNIGFNYDTGNIYYYNDGLDPAEDIVEIASHVIHVHLKDTLGGRGEWRFCALGEGRVQFPKIFQKLESIGFRGPYSLEIEGTEGEDLNREQNFQRIVKSLDYLRGIGLQF